MFLILSSAYRNSFLEYYTILQPSSTAIFSQQKKSEKYLTFNAILKLNTPPQSKSLNLIISA